MQSIIDKLFQSGKGILAADESTSTMNKRLNSVGCSEDLETRNLWREFLFNTEGIEKTISGVILYEETLNDSIVDILKDKDIEIGIKVDRGLTNFAENEQTTLGLDDLDQRLKLYKEKRVSFTKWRTIFKITNISPSVDLIEKNINDLVEYANIVISNDLIPIIEPEVLMEGNHSIDKQKEIASKILSNLAKELNNKNIDIQKCIIKTGFVLPGNSGESVTPELIARETLDMFRNNLPDDIGGVVFLSGGLSTESTFNYLKEVIKKKDSIKISLPISFSFGRALQQDALKKWNCGVGDINKAKEEFKNTLNLANKSLLS